MMKITCLLYVVVTVPLVLCDGGGHGAHGAHHVAHGAPHGAPHGAHHAPHHAPHQATNTHHRGPPRGAVPHVPLGARQPVRRRPQPPRPLLQRRPFGRYPGQLLGNKPRPSRSQLAKPGQFRAPGRLPARAPPRAPLVKKQRPNINSIGPGPSKTKQVQGTGLGTQPSGTKSLKVLLEENEHFSTLVTALKAAELIDTLAGTGPYTLFAPTNSAFDKVPVADLNALMADKEKLKATLLKHLVPGANIEGKSVPEGVVKMTTAGGNILSTNRGKFVQVTSGDGKGFVVKFDFVGSNGVYHAVDQVL